MATPLEVFLLVAGVFLISLIWSVVTQKKHEAELTKRLSDIFDKKKGGE